MEVLMYYCRSIPGNSEVHPRIGAALLTGDDKTCQSRTGYAVASALWAAGVRPYSLLT